jgi:hypothetical protein
LPGRVQQFEHGMPGESEQIEGGERHGEKFLAVAEIMFERWPRSSEQFPRFDKCRSAGFEVLLAA